MKHLVVAAVLALGAGSSFCKDKGLSPSCAALQSAKEAQASGQSFESYRVVTNDGEQVVSTPEQAIDLWGPRCQREQPSPTAHAGKPGKSLVQKTAQANPAKGG